MLVDGICREYLVHVPASYDGSRPTSLVLALHGENSAPSTMEATSGLSQVADAAGFVVVYPAGLGGNWNLYPNGSDTRFVRTLVEQLRRRGQIDSRRVYLAGYSMGGGMAHRAICELSDVIAALAAVAGEFRGHHLCGPLRPVPVMAIHGADDPVIPPAGRVEAEWPPVAAWADFWAAWNGCEATPARTVVAEVDETLWLSCRGGSEVRVWLLAGVGHEWWPRAGPEIWRFFERHTLSG